MKFQQALIKFLILSVVLNLFTFAGCAKKNIKKNDDKDSDTPKKILDKPLEQYQIKLLDKAMDIATQIPKKPFIKDRSRAQQLVVETSLELGLPVRAVRYADKIENWRKGLCYANTAYYLVQKGYSLKQVQKGLEIAQEIAQMDHNRQWRNNRIKSKIAQTYTLLGNTEKADQYSERPEDPNAAKNAQIKNLSSGEISFEQQIKIIEKGLALINFDITIECLHAYANLFNQFYEDVEKRDFVLDKIKTICKKQRIPVNVHLNIVFKLAEHALKRQDITQAQQLLEQAKSFLTDYQWPLEYYIPHYSTFIKLKYKAGDIETAKKSTQYILEKYKHSQDKLIDIYRAETLRPIAEAYQLIGQKGKALDIYKQVIEQSVVNPNPMPRAEDVSATCCSMALHKVEPDAQLWSRICQIHEELGELW